MLKGLSNIKLLALLGGLVAVYFLVDMTRNTKRSSSFRSELVEIDTAKVTKLEVKKNAEKLLLLKESAEWKVELPNGRKVSAKSASVKSTLGALLSIKPDRLAARNKDKWKDYQVDSSAMRVQTFEGSSKTLDLMIGRFGVSGQRSYHSFVRLFDEDEVYSVNNFMPFSVNSDPNNYRNSVVMKANKDSISSIKFNYPDSAFVLEKAVSGQWIVGAQDADSASVATYLGDIAYLSNTDFVDDVDHLSAYTFTVDITISGKDPIQLFAYPSQGEWAVKSSSNSEEFFASKDLAEKLFKPAAYFVK